MTRVKININGISYFAEKESLTVNSKFFQKILTEPNSEEIVIDLEIPISLMSEIDTFLYLIGDPNFNLDLFSLGSEQLHSLLLLAEYFDAPQLYSNFILPLLQKNLDDESLSYLYLKFKTPEVKKVLAEHHLKTKTYLRDLPTWVRNEILFDEEVNSLSSPPLDLEIEGPAEVSVPQKYSLKTKRGQLVLYPRPFEGDFLHLNSYLYSPEIPGVWVDEDDLLL